MKKRMLALLAVLCCVALVAALFVACNNGEKGQTDNTGVTTPADDDAQQGAETPDDEGQGGETTDPDDEQGGDTQDPADPDEGEDEKPADPSQDDEDDNKDDENEGGEVTPPIEDEKDPFVIDTFDELMEYRQGTLYDALNKNFLDGIMYRCMLSYDYSYRDATNIEWSILGSSDTDITKAQVRFNLLRGESYSYYIGEVTFNKPISVQNFAEEGKITQEMIKNASSKRVYSANVIADQMEQSRPLAEAIVTELGGALNDGDQLLVSMDNTSTDPEYSWVRNITVKQITDKGVNEYRVTIVAPGGHGDIETLLNSLANKKYNKVDIKIAVTFGEGVVIDGTQADVEVPEFEEQ